MYKESKEHVMGMRMALEREKAMNWLDNERYLAIVNHQAGASNPEACFIVGFTLVFAHQDLQRGLMCLDRAPIVGHKGTTYVLGFLLYTVGEVHDVGKHYISQVKDEPAGGGCETAKRTNRECRRCRRLAADTVREATWKEMAGPQGRLLVLPEDGHRCMSTGCGVTEGWDDYVIFYSDSCRIRLTEGWGDYIIFCNYSCRIRHEYTKFFA